MMRVNTPFLECFAQLRRDAEFSGKSNNGGFLAHFILIFVGLAMVIPAPEWFLASHVFCVKAWKISLILESKGAKANA